jgi:hypothetical protein
MAGLPSGWIAGGACRAGLGPVGARSASEGPLVHSAAREGPDGRYPGFRRRGRERGLPGALTARYGHGGVCGCAAERGGLRGGYPRVTRGYSPRYGVFPCKLAGFRPGCRDTGPYACARPCAGARAYGRARGEPAVSPPPHYPRRRAKLRIPPSRTVPRITTCTTRIPTRNPQGTPSAPPPSLPGPRPYRRA